MPFFGRNQTGALCERPRSLAFGLAFGPLGTQRQSTSEARQFEAGGKPKAIPFDRWKTEVTPGRRFPAPGPRRAPPGLAGVWARPGQFCRAAIPVGALRTENPLDRNRSGAPWRAPSPCTFYRLAEALALRSGRRLNLAILKRRFLFWPFFGGRSPPENEPSDSCD